MFQVRVSLEVSNDRGYEDSSLELIIHGTADGDSAVEAMRKVAAGIEAKVNERLGA